MFFFPIGTLDLPLLRAVAEISWSINCPQTANIMLKWGSFWYSGRCNLTETNLTDGSSDPFIPHLGEETPIKKNNVNTLLCLQFLIINEMGFVGIKEIGLKKKTLHLDLQRRSHLLFYSL